MASAEGMIVTETVPATSKNAKKKAKAKAKAAFVTEGRADVELLENVAERTVAEAEEIVAAAAVAATVVMAGASSSSGRDCTSEGGGNSLKPRIPATAGTTKKRNGASAKVISPRLSSGATCDAEDLTLLEAAGQLLRAHSAGPSMRLSSLVSALYDLSANYKDVIRQAGGAKTWLERHADDFLLDSDCAPGESLYDLACATSF